MAIQPFPERQLDRSAQVLTLLTELSDRLRKAEDERDALRRDFQQLRDFVQEIDHQNNQTQKAMLAVENRIDPAETMMESLIRRLTGLEEAVDRQNTGFLSILHKIEAQFEAYDTENKEHVGRIGHFDQMMNRFDKRLERFLADREKMTRRLEELEFHLLGKTPSVPTHMIPEGPAIGQDEDEDFTSSLPEDKEGAGLGVWAPQDAQPPFVAAPGGTSSRRIIAGMPPETWAKVLQGAAFACFLIVLAGLGYGVLQSIINLPPAEQVIQGAPSTTTTGKKAEPSLPLPSSEDLIAQAPQVHSTTAMPAAPAGGEGLFSAAVRAAMDAQMVEARKAEDTDAARLLSPDRTPLVMRAPKDEALPAAAQALLKRAMTDDVRAQHDLAALYSTGKSDVTLDYTKAAFWFREAARGGLANARYNLGVLYQQGLGVEKDMDMALAWYRTAALLDHPEARYNLGIAAAEGIGMAYNPAMAAGYFEAAARGGVIDAAYNLGNILENGLIDQPRIYEAMFWYALAAAGGHEAAKKDLARLRGSENLTEDEWKALYQKMQSTRPDLKKLIESRK